MRNSIIKKLHTRKELEDKISEHKQKYEEYKNKNEYSSMISECNDTARFFELLEDRIKSEYYYRKIVDEWHAHLRGVPNYLCINALEMLGRSEEALDIVLSNPRMWDIETLARLYEGIGRKGEAIVLYSGLARCSIKLCNVCSPFWFPHYLQDAADLYERAQDSETAHIHNGKSVGKWGEIKDNIQESFYSIEKAWLYEEIGYIHEGAGIFETAIEYYQKAESKYEKAHKKESTAVAAHHIDGDWNKYFRFFTHQIPDFRLIHFRSDGPEENDYRRIKYRILSLEEQMKNADSDLKL